MRVWTADELGRFLTAILGNRLYPRFLVLASTGMRRGEALGGRWEDLHAASAALPLTQGRCERLERGVSTNSRSRWRGVRRGRTPDAYSPARTARTFTPPGCRSSWMP